MTTATDSRAALTTQGALLLHDLIRVLVTDCGYRKTAVDTYRNDENAHNIRHQYTNGEWSLSCWTDGGGTLEVRYSVRATMPHITALVNSVLPPAF